MKTFFKDPNNQYVKEEGDSYECPHCSRTFKMERAMKSHVTKTHKIKFEPVKHNLSEKKEIPRGNSDLLQMWNNVYIIA